MELTIGSVALGGRVLLTLAGAASAETVDDLQYLAYEFLSAGHRNLVIDLNGVKVIDCSAVGALVCIQTRVRRDCGSLRVVCAEPGTLRLFDLTGLSRAFEIYPDTQSALRGARSSAE